ncbi:MAG: HD domain-containing protein [Planctomycetota bacterium]
MSSISDIPELQALSAPASLIRIPDQIDVPVTRRIMKLIDTAPFQRLIRISQLGLVSHVYPAARHNRFEHSLGVYRNALLFLRRLSSDERFVDLVAPEQATALIVAALLHDIAHWPFCHPVEDMGLPGHDEHESLAGDRIRNSEIAALIRTEFNIEPESVISLVERRKTDAATRLLCSILSGPIDVDKMDYLYRDSLHAGVPYGRNFDSARLIGSLCLNDEGDRLAITSKGRTAAELMVFARYVMFSEVYWHHAVRSATAMLQRGYYHWQSNSGPEEISEIVSMDENRFVSALLEHPSSSSMIARIFGAKRRLYKRLANYSYLDNRPVYQSLARRPYQELLKFGRIISKRLRSETGVPLEDDSVLIDAPPATLEVQFNVDVFYRDEGIYRPLGDVSPVVKTLAQEQFDYLVKQVRVFVAPEFASAIRSNVSAEQLQQLVLAATETE